MDHERFNPVSIAGMQTRATNILHGSFRIEMKLEGYDGGSCASFFWYHNDAQELDIEVVTPGTSVVNDTINYTTQPSVNADWSRIPNATQSVPLERTMDTFHTYGFDCDLSGSKYYLDDQLVHEDHRAAPQAGGSLQLKLWADGNKWWSGIPSTSDVYMHVKRIEAHFNITGIHGVQERARLPKRDSEDELLDLGPGLPSWWPYPIFSVGAIVMFWCVHFVTKAAKRQSLKKRRAYYQY